MFLFLAPLMHATVQSCAHSFAVPIPTPGRPAGVLMVNYSDLNLKQIQMLLGALNAYDNSPFDGKLLKVVFHGLHWQRTCCESLIPSVHCMHMQIKFSSKIDFAGVTCRCCWSA